MSIVFKHRPKLGDIVYSLPLIRSLGGGVLYLDPNSPYFKAQKGVWTNIFEEFALFLKEQEYIEDCKVYNGEVIELDLDDYMKTTHLVDGDKVSIVENHFKGLKCDFDKVVDERPWLKVKPKRIAKIIVSNSGRYLNPSADYSFLRGKESDCVFVGTTVEHLDFMLRTSLNIAFHKTEGFKDLASVISGSDYFVGNQSFPLSLAIGLGKKVYVEQSVVCPNCIVGEMYNEL